jgi:hypothetical protein
MIFNTKTFSQKHIIAFKADFVSNIFSQTQESNFNCTKRAHVTLTAWLIIFNYSVNYELTICPIVTWTTTLAKIQHLRSIF